MQAIPAFEEGIATMRAGGIRRMEIPGEIPSLSYPRDRSQRFTNELVPNSEGNVSVCLLCCNFVQSSFKVNANAFLTCLACYLVRYGTLHHLLQARFLHYQYLPSHSHLSANTHTDIPLPVWPTTL